MLEPARFQSDCALIRGVARAHHPPPSPAIIKRLPRPNLWTEHPIVGRSGWWGYRGATAAPAIKVVAPGEVGAVTGITARPKEALTQALAAQVPTRRRAEPVRSTPTRPPVVAADLVATARLVLAGTATRRTRPSTEAISVAVPVAGEAATSAGVAGKAEAAPRVTAGAPGRRRRRFQQPRRHICDSHRRRKTQALSAPAARDARPMASRAARTATQSSVTRTRRVRAAAREYLRDRPTPDRVSADVAAPPPHQA